MNKNVFAAILILFLTICSPQANDLFAADHTNLEENLPLEITDAIPTPYMNREVQSAFHYERTEDSKDKYEAEQRLEYGIFLNSQIEVHVPYQFGRAVDEGLGVTEAAVLYNFNQESIWIPAMALSGHALFPTAEDTDEIEPKAKFIMTKTIGRSSFFQRIHANASWQKNNDRHENERKDLYSWAIGYDCRLNPETLLVFDLVREMLPEKGKDMNLAEIGLRYQLHPRVVISMGGGAGLGSDSPHTRATFGFQYSF
ncbi:MAG: meta-pathway of phenol degradation [Candidatus Omnitrophica bacterium]|nr:meta-pathway of phenol degradation [Candidatus Omnitrophota bacterium]